MNTTQDITKEQLEHLYHTEEMTLDEIGKHFGFYDRQPIQRLFKKFEIQKRNKSEQASIKNAKLCDITIDKDTLVTELQNNSISKVARKYNVHRSRISKLMESYGLKSNYFVNVDIKHKINSDEYSDMSPKELAMLFNVNVKDIKYYKKTFKEISYDAAEVKKKIIAYNYDLDNQGLIAQLKYDDKNLYDSIIRLTTNHVLQSTKITERLYRILHDYKHDDVDKCKYCSSALKFYTVKIGYGLSEHKICKNCSTSVNGVSLISQRLFNSIYDKLSLSCTDVCNYDNLNNEKVVHVTENDYEIIPDNLKPHLNKNRYLLDFVFNDKIIEFDGDYYHTEPNKELAKDLFLTSKGYKILHIREQSYLNDSNAVVKQCLDFLAQ